MRNLLSIPEFVSWARICRTKTYAEIGLGRLRATKLGRRTYVKNEDAVAWLNNQPLMPEWKR